MDDVLGVTRWYCKKCTVLFIQLVYDGVRVSAAKGENWRLSAARDEMPFLVPKILNYFWELTDMSHKTVLIRTLPTLIMLVQKENVGPQNRYIVYLVVVHTQKRCTFFS